MGETICNTLDIHSKWTGLFGKPNSRRLPVGLLGVLFCMMGSRAMQWQINNYRTYGHYIKISNKMCLKTIIFTTRIEKEQIYMLIVLSRIKMFFYSRYVCSYHFLSHNLKCSSYSLIIQLKDWQRYR